MSASSSSAFIAELKVHSSETEAAKIGRFFKDDEQANRIIGVRMRDTFQLAKDNRAMSLSEVSKLLDSEYYEARMGAVSILDFKAKDKKLAEQDRREIYDLYLDKHDRINNWDLVDRAAPFVIGRYLIDKPRDVLYELAESDDRWRRRTAITAALYFIRYGERSDLDDVLALAEALLDDTDEFVLKSVGIALKHVADVDRQLLINFLDAHAADMQQATLTYAVGKLTAEEKANYRRVNRAARG